MHGREGNGSADAVADRWPITTEHLLAAALRPYEAIEIATAIDEDDDTT